MTLRGLRKIIRVIREIRVRKPYASRFIMVLRGLNAENLQSISFFRHSNTFFAIHCKKEQTEKED